MFGNIREQQENVENVFKYAGEQLDSETQQYYLRARFYNPVIARFTQEDVYRGDGLNLYVYVVNNPLLWFDPSGYAKCPTLSSEEQIAYEAARARGMGVAEAYYSATNRNLLNQTGSNYIVQREQDQIMNHYTDLARRHYSNRQGTGTAQQVGSWTHADVANDMQQYILVNQQDLPYIDEIQIEQNHIAGLRIPNNARGSSRVDIAITNKVNNNVHVGDIKTGNAHYSNRQQAKNERNINGPNGQNGYTFTHEEVKP